jgi:hypothetical protein
MYNYSVSDREKEKKWGGGAKGVESKKHMGREDSSLIYIVSISRHSNDRCNIMNSYKKKSKAIPVTGRGGPYGCETSRLSHFLDTRLTDRGEVVNLMRRQPFTPRKILGTHFC